MRTTTSPTPIAHVAAETVAAEACRPDAGPIELTLEEIEKVAGGLGPAGTWSAASTTLGPAGTW